MSPHISKRLVIDADVARAAGGKNAVYPTSKHCRDFLEAVRKISHRVVMTREIKEEWDEHQSNFARTWLYKMFGARRVEVVGDSLNEDLRRKIRRAASCERDCLVMMKDVHLLEAALITDNTIISMDETVHVLFSAASSKVGEIRVTLWVNPDDDDEVIMRWLEGEADPKRNWIFAEHRASE